MLTGDDISRTANELNNSITNPWAPEAIQYAFGTARDSKRVICVEIVDETSFLWGNTPTPTDGRWLKKNPPIPDNAFVRLMKTINAVPDRPPISWPIGGISGNDAAQNWMGNPAFADYASQYWDVMDWRREFPDHASLPQNMEAMDRAVVGRLPVIQRDKPALLLMSICSAMYTKPRPGEFTPDDYRLQGVDVPPASVSTQVMYAAAMGMAGVRAYAYDGPWQADRQRAHPGEQCQVGASPLDTGSDRWQAMSSAFNLVKRLEPYLLQPQMNAIDLGPNVVTGARRGKDSRLLIAVNFSPIAEPVHVDFTPYRYNNGATIVRYRLTGATLCSDVLPNTPIENITLAPGESVVWLFRPAPANQKTDVTPPEVIVTAPLPNATVTGKVTVKATATDNVKVTRVEFAVDGTVASTLKAAPFTYTWDTATAKADVWHSLTVTAYDAAGNASEERLALRPTR